MGLCHWKVRLVKSCWCKLTEELLHVSPSYPTGVTCRVKKDLLIFLAPLLYLVRHLLLSLHSSVYFLHFFYVLKFSPLWDIKLFSIKLSWVIPIWQNNINTKAFPNTMVSKKYFTQLMMCLETYIVFLFYAFSFLSEDTNGLTKLVASSEGISVRF